METLVTGDGARGPDAVSGSRRVLTADRVLAWACVFVIANSLVGLVTTLIGVFHAPQVVLISILLTILYAHKTRAADALLPGPGSRWVHLVVLVLVALVFRAPAYHYVLGGQDEGVYVNVGHYIDHTGGISVHDRVKRQLQGSPFLEHYLAENTIGNGSYLAAVYARGYKNSKLEFQFYHVFPVWLATFGGLFGKTSAVYALTFLSLLSIVLLYRLALLLSGSYRVAVVASLLLAVNPLHAFFSKFPVTEIPTLCFALAGFLFIAAHWLYPHTGIRRYWLLLSVGAFLCVFTTRISGFMYVPFFIALAWAALVFDEDRDRCQAIQQWAVCVALVYLLSVVYGLTWSHAYSHDIYHLSFQPLLGSRWRAVLAVMGAVAVVAWAVLAWATRSRRVRALFAARLRQVVQWAPSVVVWVALCLGLFKIYRLGWTRHYASDAGLDTVWRLVDHQWVSASASSLWALVIFVGPLLALAFLALTAVKRRSAPVVFMFWFVAGFFAYIALLQWVLPYLPYYSRYLVSELVPYSILLVACMWGALPAGTGRRLLSIALVLSGVYATALSTAQIGKNENDGAYTALARIMAPVGPADLVLLRTTPGGGFNQSQVKMPLLYTFHREVVTVGRADLADAAYLAKLDSLYDDIFLLEPEGSAPPGFKLVANTEFKVMQYRWTHSFPYRLQAGPDVVLNLFQMEHVRMPVGGVAGFSTGGIGVGWLGAGWSVPESWGIWSDGPSAVLRIDPRDLPDGDDALSLRVRANVFVTPQHPTQHVAVTVDGRMVGNYAVTYPQANLVMTIPLGHLHGGSSKRTEIGFALPDAVSPRSLGVSRDGRVLALGLIDATVESSAATPLANPDQKGPRGG